MRSFRLPLLDPSGSRDSAVPALSPNAFDPSKLQNLALYLRADRDVQSDTALQLVAASSQYLSLANTGNENTFNLDGTSFTVAGWFRLNSIDSGTQTIAGKWANNSTDKAWRVSISSANNFGTVLSADGTSTGGSSTLTSEALAADTWYFFTTRYDGVNIVSRLYDTSALLATRTTAYGGGVYNTSAEFAIGRHSGGGWYFDGRIDSLAVYKGKALSDAECDTLWNAGTGTTYSDLSAAQKTSLLSWWDMNEASGTRKDSHTGGYDLTENPGTILSEVGITVGAASDKDSVSLWLGQSPIINNASQGSASLRPTLQLNLVNGKPGLAFDGSDDALSTSLFLDLTGDLLIAWVENYTSGVSTLFFESMSPISFIRHDSATSLTVGDVFSATSQVNHADIATPDVSHISMLDRKSGVLTYYLDGTPYSLGSFPEAWSFDRIGKIQGDLLELIVVAGSNPAQGQRNQLGRYLARKYALTWNPTP